MPPARHFRRKKRGLSAGLIALIITGSVGLVILAVVAGIVAYHHLRPAGSNWNRERLVGIWEANADNGRGTLEFTAEGGFRVVTDFANTGHSDNKGTWELLAANGNRVKIRMVASDAGGTYRHVWELNFLDNDTLARADRPEMVFHRRR